MQERIWSEPDKTHIPADSEIIMANVEAWNAEIAQLTGFDSLLPKEEPLAFYYVAVARNANGEIVGAKSLIDMENLFFANTEDKLKFMSERAQRIFGIKAGERKQSDR